MSPEGSKLVCSGCHFPPDIYTESTEISSEGSVIGPRLRYQCPPCGFDEDMGVAIRQANRFTRQIQLRHEGEVTLSNHEVPKFIILGYST